MASQLKNRQRQCGHDNFARRIPKTIFESGYTSSERRDYRGKVYQHKTPYWHESELDNGERDGLW